MDVKSHVLVANARTRIHHPGRFFMLIETGAELDVTFEFRGSPIGEIGVDVQAGYKRFPGNWADLKDGRFDTVVLTSAINQTVVIGISQSAADYTRTLSVVEVEQPNAGSTAGDQTAGVGSSEIAASNADRRLIHIQNTGTTNNARVGPGVVTATRGVQLQPGQSVTLRTSAAINAIREGGADTTLGVTEESRT